jgi:hypothetical protein
VTTDLPTELPSEKRARGRTPAWLGERAKVAARGWGKATADLRPLPDFVIIGTKRGGTTSLYHYLLQHQQVLPMIPSRLKSPHYFYWHYDSGERWYRSHFRTRPYRVVLDTIRHTPTVTGEASPYYLYHPFTAERMHSLMPRVKVIATLRDPVRRAYSHYQERVNNGVEPLSFEDALAAEPDRLAGEIEKMHADPLYYSRAHDWYSYRDRGIYAPQLERWLRRYPSEQILLLASEDFYADEQGTYDRVTDFLGISRQPLASTPQYNYRPVEPLSAQARDELTEFYRPHNAALFELIGRDLGWPA